MQLVRKTMKRWKPMMALCSRGLISKRGIRPGFWCAAGELSMLSLLAKLSYWVLLDDIVEVLEDQVVVMKE